jgi:hypothetical protein
MEVTKMPGSDILQMMYEGVISKMFPEDFQAKWRSMMSKVGMMEAADLLERLGENPSQPQKKAGLTPEEELLQSGTIGEQEKKKKEAKHILSIWPD